MAGNRPFGVTLVAIIAWLNGLWQILVGIFSILPGGTSIWAGPFIIVFGILTIIVSFGLFGGRNWARILTAILFALNLLGALTLLFGGQFWQGIGGAILPLIGLILLFSQKANAFFRS
ncbi:hypothetical protein [Microbacterium telephonicum]|uniref:Uncharacterized protein n=1 Tax=Microbacterium telephonicum TaxID=1714841 RepID=A0A498CC71_9MICO|nr:hypothetical protein [Microbacterium telephonicum]RLK52757.1 hypothetical protein C7474_0714 [Microbacterium telephonicum]